MNEKQMEERLKSIEERFTALEKFAEEQRAALSPERLRAEFNRCRQGLQESIQKGADDGRT